MVWIPDPRIIRIGDKVQLIKDHKTHGGTFTAGHEFKVTQMGGSQRDGDWLKIVDTDGRETSVGAEILRKVS